MKFMPERELDKGIVINWVADKVNQLGCWLVKVSSPYALYYTAEFEDEGDNK